ncbi:b(0,+)-type amino acid transporter 1-like isoform X1 [Dendronephthya gigantea]|uniref:b(0,+)-type amino acid transporter 1-like isoform X1 n=1 Tax=Dendronephthya gigantea TaxID=151771 RepID=UPI00106A62DA|nr:b(0,+)-type amino acid transporter 1-like isoform X1 [Dendronephthya gigantea]
MSSLMANEERPPSNSSSPETEKGLLNGDKPSGVSLKRDVGLLGGVAVIVGTMIGSGIFASPKGVLEASGSVGMALIVWAICGVLAVCGAMAYAELGTMIPSSGGEYVYLRESFGALPSFLYAWTACIVIKPSQLAIICLIFGEYIVTPFFPDCTTRSDVQTIIKLLAALAIAIITIVNCLSVKLAARVQVFFMAAKLLALALIILTGIVRLFQGYTTELDGKHSFSGTATVSEIGLIGQAFYNGLWAYDGWNNLNYISEEVHDPNKNIPRAIGIGIPLVTFVYLLTNIAYFTVLSEQDIIEGGAVAVLFANKMFGVMAWIIPVFVACSTFGAANGSALSSGRVFYAASKNGELPKFMAMIHNARFTPIPGLIVQSIIAWLMLIPESSGFSTLIDYFTFASWVFYGATISGLLYMRFSKPNAERPFRVFFIFPVIIIIAALYLIIAPFSQNPLPSFFCLLFIFAGVPVYFIFVYYKLSPQWLDRGIEWFTFWVQKFGDISYPEHAEDIVVG